MWPSNIHLYQIVILIVSVFMLYQGIERYFKHQNGQTFLKLFFRLIIWGGMVAVAVFPKITNTLAQFIGIEDNINAVVLTGFFLVFLMIFKLLSAIERLEQQITSLTRKEALSDIQKENEN